MPQRGVNHGASASRAASALPATCRVRPASLGTDAQTRRATTRPAGVATLRSGSVRLGRGRTAMRAEAERVSGGLIDRRRQARAAATRLEVGHCRLQVRDARDAARWAGPEHGGDGRGVRTCRHAGGCVTTLDKALRGGATCDARPCAAAGAPRPQGRARPDRAARPGGIAGPAGSGGPGWPTRAARRWVSAA